MRIVAIIKIIIVLLQALRIVICMTHFFDFLKTLARLRFNSY